MKNKNGSIVVLALIGVVAIVLVAVTYIFYSKLVLPAKSKPAEASQNAVLVDPETKTIENVDKKTDDVDSIQKDLDNTDYSTLDQDVLGVKTAADGL